LNLKPKFKLEKVGNLKSRFELENLSLNLKKLVIFNSSLYQVSNLFKFVNYLYFSTKFKFELKKVGNI